MHTLMTLLILALSTFVIWEFVGSILPFTIPPIIQPIVVVAMAYGLWHTPVHWLIPVATAGIVAILHGVLAVRHQPADWTRFKTFLKRGGKQTKPQVGARIPRL